MNVQTKPTDAFLEFRQQMADKGFPMRCMWQRKAWDDSEDGCSPAPTVECYLIANPGSQAEKLPHMAIFTRYPEGGWDMFPIAPGGKIADDIALLTGEERDG